MLHKHTPGPWEVVPDSTCSGAWLSIRPKGKGFEDEICHTCGPFAVTRDPSKATTYEEDPSSFRHEEGSERTMADAELIAAAPMMLKQVERLERKFAVAGAYLTNYQGGGDQDDVIEACKELSEAYEAIPEGLYEGADNLTDVIRWFAADRKALLDLLRKVQETVRPDAMFAEGEDPHPPAALAYEIEEALANA